MIMPLEKPGTPEELVHFGTKGMKWGIRKERAQSLTGFGPDKIVRKTKNGDTFTLEKNPPTRLHKVMSAMSERYTQNYKNTAFMTIKDKNGKSVGEASFWTKGKDELYLNWIQVDKSSRGKGYATASLKAAQEFGKKAGMKRLILEVPGISPDARHIYEKLGFKVTRELSTKSNDPMWNGLTEMEYKFKE